MTVLRVLGDACLVVGGVGLGYTLFLALIAAAGGKRRRPEAANAAPRVAVLIPAHDEAGALGPLLKDLRDQTRPPAVVLVVADRCSDGTERVAAEGGAEVLALHGPEGGKAVALARGFRHLEDREWDTVLVVDADCRLDPGYLARCDAGPDEVVQSRVVLRAGRGSRGVLYDYLSRIENEILHGGRARMGLPGFLRGTGMLLGRSALARCPWRSGGLTEDRTQGFLFLAVGVPVRHDPGLEIVTLPPERAEESWHQRRRWTSVGLLSHAVAATGIAWKASRHFGLRVWELPLAVVADARSQWMLLLGVGTVLAAVSAGPVRWGGGMLVAAALGATLAGVVWYGSRFVWVLIQAPVGAAVAMASGTLSLLGIRPGTWRKGRPG